jgi:hypothetical protein
VSKLRLREQSTEDVVEARNGLSFLSGIQPGGLEGFSTLLTEGMTGISRNGRSSRTELFECEGVYGR